MKKIQLEIWSDIACPFCYIGKRRLEAALAQFTHHDEVEVRWRSFELAPNEPTAVNRNLYQVLAERKGMSVPQARQMSSQVAQQAASAGLTFDFEHVVPANTFNAHRLIHLAAAHNRQDAMKERLLRAYFTEGQNIDDVPTLLKLAGEAGLNVLETQQVLASDAYTQEVRHDEYQARQIGVRGVPYFVFNNKYAVSGAQPSELFHEVLEKVWAEAQPATVQLSGSEGAACDIDGNC